MVKCMKLRSLQSLARSPGRYLRGSSAAPGVRCLSISRISKEKSEIPVDNAATSAPIPDFAFVFDIDGVLVRGQSALPKASETLARLIHQKVPFLLLTNGGGKSEEQRARDLTAELRVPIDANMIVQSHTPFSDMDQYKHGCALIVGGKGDNCGVVANGYGFKNVLTPTNIFRSDERIWPLSSRRPDDDVSWKPPKPMPSVQARQLKIDSIFVFNDPVDWGLDLALITDCLLSEKGILGTLSPKNGDNRLPNRGYQQDGQPSLFFSNDDLWYAAQYSLPRLGQGGFRAAVEGVWAAITGGPTKGVELKKTIIGKPHQGTYGFAEKRLEARRRQQLGSADLLPALKQVYMIGDNPDSDIRGAMNYKSPLGTRWSSALIRTGVFAGGIPSAQPTVILNDVQSAVTWGLQQSGWHNI